MMNPPVLRGKNKVLRNRRSFGIFTRRHPPEDNLAIDQFAVPSRSEFAFAVLCIISDDGCSDTSSPTTFGCGGMMRTNPVALSAFQAAPVEAIDTGVSDRPTSAGCDKDDALRMKLEASCMASNCSSAEPS